MRAQELLSRVSRNHRFITACVLVCLSFGGFADVVVGNGRVESEGRSLPSFRSIQCSGSGTLRVHKGSQKVVISADSNILPFVTTSVSGGELRIGLKPMTMIMKASKMQFDVTLPDLSGIDLSGSGETSIDAFKGESFDAKMSGSGSLRASLDYKELSYHSSGSGSLDATIIAGRMNIDFSGSGELKLRGAAESVDIGISGSGSIAGRDFVVNELEIDVSGSSDIEIQAKKSIKSRVSGSGSIRYWGNPTIDQHTSGSGRIERAGD